MKVILIILCLTFTLQAQWGGWTTPDPPKLKQEGLLLAYDFAETPLLLDGAGENSINLGDPAGLEPASGKLLISIWVNQTDNANRDVAWGKLSDIQLQTSATGLSFEGGSTDDWDNRATATGLNIKGTWTFLSIAFDGTYWKIYNGITLMDTGAAASALPTWEGNDWIIGDNGDGDDDYLQGSLGMFLYYASTTLDIESTLQYNYNNTEADY